MEIIWIKNLVSYTDLIKNNILSFRWLLFQFLESLTWKNNNNELIILSTRDLSCYSCLEPHTLSKNCTCESNKCGIKTFDSNSDNSN